MLKSVGNLNETFILSNLILYKTDLVLSSTDLAKVLAGGLLRLFLMDENPFRPDWVRDAGAWNREDFTRPAGLQGNTQRKFYLYITSLWHENIVCFCYFCGNKMWWILVNVDAFMNYFDSMKCLLDINKLFYAFYCTF